MRTGGAQAFADWLLQLGEGKLQDAPDDIVPLPPHMCTGVNIRELIEWVFDDLAAGSASHSCRVGHAILAARNTRVNEINDYACDMFPGQTWECMSSDDTINADRDALAIPTEYLNSLMPTGLPPHRLVLKKGMPIMLTRNINPREGLCNGTRLVVQDVVGGRMLHAKICGGIHDGRDVLVPRVILRPMADKEMPFLWQRRQFPVRLGFAMTINKAQGQTLQRVGVFLEEPVFGHGQLYVAASRVRHPDNIRFATHGGVPCTRNVVYREALL